MRVPRQRLARSPAFVTRPCQDLPTGADEQPHAEDLSVPLPASATGKSRVCHHEGQGPACGTLGCGRAEPTVVTIEVDGSLSGGSPALDDPLLRLQAVARAGAPEVAELPVVSRCAGAAPGSWRESPAAVNRGRQRPRDR